MNRKSLSFVVLATACASLVQSLCWFGVFVFVNGYLVKELGCSNREWTAATLWLTGGMVFWYAACTEITCRIGRRMTVLASLYGMSVLFALLAASRNILAVSAILAFMGSVSAAYYVAWVPLAAGLRPKRPGQIFGITQMVNVLIGIAALISGAFLVARLSYRAAFLCFSAVSLVCAAAFCLLTRGLPEEEEVVSISRSLRRELSRFTGGAFLVVVLFGIILEPFNFHTVNQLFPNLARDVGRMGERGITSLVALGRVPGLLSLLAVAHVIDRHNPLRWYGAALVLSGLTVAGMRLMDVTGSLAGSYFLFYVFHGCLWGSNCASVARTVPVRLRDPAFAVMNILMMLGTFFVGFIHNRLIASGLSLPGVFLVCGLVAAAGGSVLFVYGSRRVRRC